jgi:hypothetical protein
MVVGEYFKNITVARLAPVPKPKAADARRESPWSFFCSKQGQEEELRHDSTGKAASLT